MKPWAALQEPCCIVLCRMHIVLVRTGAGAGWVARRVQDVGSGIACVGAQKGCEGPWQREERLGAAPRCCSGTKEEMQKGQRWELCWAPSRKGKRFGYFGLVWQVRRQSLASQSSALAWKTAGRTRGRTRAALQLPQGAGCLWLQDPGEPRAVLLLLYSLWSVGFPKPIQGSAVLGAVSRLL